LRLPPGGPAGWWRSCCPLLADLLADLLAGLLDGLLAGLLAGLLTGLLAGLLADLLTRFLAGLFAGLLDGLIVLRGCADPDELQDSHKEVLNDDRHLDDLRVVGEYEERTWVINELLQDLLPHVHEVKLLTSHETPKHVGC